MSSLKVQDDYVPAQKNSSIWSNSHRNNFNRYGISKYLKNIYKNNEFSIPMISRSDSVKNAPLRLSVEARKSSGRN